MFWTKMVGIFLIEVIVRGSTTREMYRSTPEDCKPGKLFWFGVVMKASCTTSSTSVTCFIAVSAFLAPTCDQRVYRSTQSVLKIEHTITNFTCNLQPALKLRCG
jgi:hypothetical protein